MKKSPLLLAGALALALAAALLWYRSWHSERASLEGEAPPQATDYSGRAAPPFSLSDIHGNIVASTQFRGRPTVINFFATWCPPCREEIPGFVDVYNKYRGKGFELIGISLDKDTKENLPHFLLENRIEYRILLGDLPTARAYGGVTTLPTTFFVGRDGEIKNVHVGYIDRDAFEREVRKIL